MMIGQVIESYDRDRRFPVYGFGACVSSMSANHCFPLNGNPSDPEVVGVSGVMDIYHTALYNVRFSGPTLFTPILEKAMR